MLLIDSFAYHNRLRAIHPAEKALFTALTLAVGLAFPRPPVSLAVIVVMAFLTLRAGIPPAFYLRLLLLPLSFLLLGVATVAVSIASQPLPLLWGFGLGPFQVGLTAAGLALAGELLLKSLAAVTCLYFLALTTPVLEIVWVLRQARVPALFLDLMLLVYTFVFILLETAGSIYTSQASRWGYASFRQSYASLGWLAANLFAKSHRRAQLLFAALSARCYQGDLRVLEMRYVSSRKNLALVAAFEVALIGLVWWTEVSLLV